MKGSRVGLGVAAVAALVAAMIVGVGELAAAPAAPDAPARMRTSWNGPMWNGVGWTLVYHAVNTDDTAAHPVSLEIIDADGIVEASENTVLPPGGHTALVFTPVSNRIDPYRNFRARSNSPFILTSVEVIDTATGVPTELVEPSTPIGRRECAIGGPLTMSDSLDEIVMLTNITSEPQSAVITYTEGASDIGQQLQLIPANATVAVSYPTTSGPREILVDVMAPDATAPTLIAAIATVDPVTGEQTTHSALWFHVGCNPS